MAARGRIGIALTVILTGLAALVAKDSAALGDVRRCEGADGQITYSNEPCPTGTAKERAVEDRPAVVVPHDAGSEKAVRSGKVTGTLQSTGQADAKSPENAQEQKKALVARCDDLVRRIEYGQQDLLSAAAAERASIELGVRRLQEEHQASCVMH